MKVDNKFWHPEDDDDEQAENDDEFDGEEE